MKCRARQVVEGEKIDQVMRTFGYRVLEEIEAETAELLLGECTWFGRENRLSDFFAGHGDVLESYLAKNTADRLFVKDRRGRREAEEWEIFSDTIDGSLWEIRRDLSGEGFDVTALEDAAEGKAPDKPAIGHDARIMREARVSWYAYNGRTAVQSWIGCAAFVLRDMRYPCGRRRFSRGWITERILMPLAEHMAGWLTRFLDGTDAADRDLAARHRAQARRLDERYGVQLIAAQDQGHNGRDVIKATRGERGAGAGGVDLGAYEKLLTESSRTRFAGRR